LFAAVSIRFPVSRLVSALLAFALLLPTLAAAPTAAAEPRQQAVEFPITVTDSAGRTVTVGAAPSRIVSLAPSTTEIVCAVGACDRVVATDSLSDYPAEVKGRPQLGSGRIGAESVLAQQPDLVVGAGITSQDLVRQLESFGVPVLIVDAKSFDDVFAGIEMVGGIVGSDSAPSLVQNLRDRVRAVTDRTTGLEHRPTVYHELDSLLFSVTRDTYVGSMIDAAGGQNILASAATPYPQISAEYVITANPDIIVLADAAYGVSPESVTKRPGWAAVTAVKTGRIYPIDPDLSSRPGPRIVDGLEAYARLLHPDLFPEPTQAP
jgi:iron complex transport system substrate-binding protein